MAVALVLMADESDSICMPRRFGCRACAISVVQPREYLIDHDIVVAAVDLCGP